MSQSWKPNPNASPYVPRRLLATPKSIAIDLGRPSTNGHRKSPSLRTRLCQSFLVVVLLFTLVVNVVFIYDASRRLRSADVERLNGEPTRPLHETKNPEVVAKSSSTTTKRIQISLVSSRESATVSVDGTIVLDASGDDVDRGMHVVVLNEATGSVMASRHFDTYAEKGDEAMALFVNMVADGRLLCFVVKDEASFSLKQPARDLLARLGSRHARALAWRDMWAFVARKRGGGSAAPPYGEAISKSASVSEWGAPARVDAAVPLVPLAEAGCRRWPNDEENSRRREFCEKYEGYGSLCDCDHPSPIIVSSDAPLPGNRLHGVPIAIIASNRPFYLYRMLRSLFAARGAPDASMVTIFIDGFNEQPAALARLFGVRGVQHMPQSEKNGRIAQHYKASLTALFDLYPKADYGIIIEEDLDVSVDFFAYFSATMPLLEKDASLYCISAWNDLGYDHSAMDSSLLYRVETMPGLGWMLSRRLYKNELEPQWPTPDKLWDWDMWMRLPQMRKGRECIVPDVSRTYHFGETGLNMNSYFQEAYFKKHSLNVDTDVVFRDLDHMTKDGYEEILRGLLNSARLLDHTKKPCDEDFVPETRDQVYVMFIVMNGETDYATWMEVAKCFRLWDLDARGFHRGLWRFFLKGNHVLVVGTPHSPYAQQYKPADVTPILLEREKKEKKK
ncbi:protein O-linked-mannose beta-1,2-N-acetylglucosaminyltransferase 1-like [Oscarella lobularis]|uniref:protein O-linked-mannose beta-1,2-N-acetylglucosaminyltransferase 1-like n=1 Tax=Oscarella lobularis TaxID=121494 RepID=UPI0033140540